MIGWAIFNFTDMELLFKFLGGLFSLKGGLYTDSSLLVILSYLPLTILGCVLSTPVIKVLHRKLKYKKFYPVFLCAFVLLSMLLCTASLVSNSYNPFIYFRF